MYNMQKYKYIILHHSQGKTDERTKPFCFSEWYGTGHMFAYRNLFTSCESRGDGRNWCKQLSSWEILLKILVRKREKLCARVRPFKIDLEGKWHWSVLGQSLYVCSCIDNILLVSYQTWKRVIGSFGSSLSKGSSVICKLLLDRFHSSLHSALTCDTCMILVEISVFFLPNLPSLGHLWFDASKINVYLMPSCLRWWELHQRFPTVME